MVHTSRPIRYPHHAENFVYLSCPICPEIQFDLSSIVQWVFHCSISIISPIIINVIIIIIGVSIVDLFVYRKGGKLQAPEVSTDSDDFVADMQHKEVRVERRR